ncbi:TetR/AcrR family transcriptional regulator [Nocardia otitidiscaviarum]|uniref:TetR/AcrR family transcriptional regulator n=1 Tax=Nocardia otitidiscaviarum TaxID=1823 RepID=UPI0009DCD898|nr:TetR/AcrR family transcriptional regulator [Nocardia otitidiscaviarum]MBF6489018.1 TetR/AcrR family transcriptional regulator [Nocardia otitidiscaviarum]
MPAPLKSPPKRQPRMDLEVRRVQVLDAALRLVVRDGYAAATMEAIAREAQLAKPRVYAAYPGRGPLLLALLEREQRRTIDTLATAMPPFDDDSDFETILTTAATNLLHAVVEHPESALLLTAPADDAPAEVREHAARARAFARDNLRALIEWARPRRPDLSRLDPELLSIALLAVGEQLVRLAVIDPDRYPPTHLADFVTTAVDHLSRPAGT